LANASDAWRWARSELTSCSSPWEDFPPTAVLGAMVMKQGRIGQSHELIIAVDAQRTRNVGELESALSQTEPGETVYLTVVSGGRREQVHVNPP